MNMANIDKGTNSSKWNASQISQFLEIYREFPTLWDSSRRDYKDRNLRDKATRDLVARLKNVLPNITQEVVRAKIKCIKTVLSQEWVKIIKSKKSGAGTEEVYTPKLSWWKAAQFLKGSTASRTTLSTMDFNAAGPSSRNPSPILSDIDRAEIDEPTQLPKNKFRKREIDCVNDVVTKLQDISKRVSIQKVSERDDEETTFGNYVSETTFGNYVSAQLRKLDPIRSLRAQKKIHEVLMEERMASLTDSPSIHSSPYSQNTNHISHQLLESSTPHYLSPIRNISSSTLTGEESVEIENELPEIDSDYDEI